MRKIIAIDPGTTDGAYVVWDCSESKIVDKAILPNEELLDWLRNQTHAVEIHCEMIACYGMAVGKETFETCVWIGRAMQICVDKGWAFSRVYRLSVKVHHCKSTKAKDSNVRQALIDKYGVQGTKKVPGPLFGIASHMWSALAVATFVSETTSDLTVVSVLLSTNSSGSV